MCGKALRELIEKVVKDKEEWFMRMYSGTITSIDPFKIKLNEKISIGSEQIVCLESVRLKLGDCLVMIRSPVSDKFFVMGTYCDVQDRIRESNS